MAQEAIVRAIITDVLTGRPPTTSRTPGSATSCARRSCERIHEETDVHADDILFPDLTVQ